MVTVWMAPAGPAGPGERGLRTVPVTLKIIPVAFINFCAYLGVGLPLAALPIHVSLGLGYGEAAAGTAVSIQFLATMLTRAAVGRLSDRIGPRRTVHYGIATVVASGLLLVGAGLVSRGAVGFAMIIASRLLMGFGESCTGTGSVLWNIGRLGVGSTTQIFTWSGIAAYGAIAAGAPLGSVLYGGGGLWAVGAAVIAAALVALAISLCFAATPAAPKGQQEEGGVVGLVLPYGIALMLGSVGFGTIASFCALYFVDRGWAGGATAVTLFGACFVLVRLVVSGALARLGGHVIAIGALALEGIGLLVLAFATGPAMAFVGVALAGLGFGPVFPSLGGIVVKVLPANGRGAAIGFFTVFLDLSIAISGPAAGLLIAPIGYSGIFGLVAVAAFLAGGMVMRLRRRAEASEP